VLWLGGSKRDTDMMICLCYVCNCAFYKILFNSYCSLVIAEVNYDHTSHVISVSQLALSLSHPIRLVVNCLPGGSQVSGDVPLATHVSLVQSQTQIVDVLTLLGCHCSNLCHTLHSDVDLELQMLHILNLAHHWVS